MIRRIHKIEWSDGEFVTLPGNRYSRETEQGLHNSFVDLTGADYAYDTVGIGRAARKNAIERVSFLIVEDDPGAVNLKFEELEERLQGRVKLWSNGTVDGYGSEEERWAYARLVSMPLLQLDVTHRRHMPVTLIFERMTDWEVDES